MVKDLTLAECKIGMAVATRSRLYRITDVGTRTIVVLYLDEIDTVLSTVVEGKRVEITAKTNPRLDPSWHNEPTYAAAEEVLDEDDFNYGIRQVPEDKVLAWVPTDWDDDAQG